LLGKLRLVFLHAGHDFSTTRLGIRAKGLDVLLAVVAQRLSDIDICWAEAAPAVIRKIAVRYLCT
jgi:hypothetical protein